MSNLYKLKAFTGYCDSKGAAIFYGDTLVIEYSKYASQKVGIVVKRLTFIDDITSPKIKYDYESDAWDMLEDINRIAVRL